MLLYVVASIYVVRSLDDFFIDVVYWGSRLSRLWFIRPWHRQPTEHDLLSVPEKPIAIMIPGWEEAAMIGRMLENTVRSLNYSNYRIFVCAYQNDPATQEEVAKVQQRSDKVELVVCPHQGPTNK